jgi:long-subunit fatty acid transport protein
MKVHLKGRWLSLVLPLLAMCVFSQQGTAFTYRSYPYGEKIGALDARSLSMGGTGVAFQDNAFALSINPACLTQVKNFGASSSILVVKVDEDRAFPYHDSFEGFVDYNTYAMNSNLYGTYAFGAVKVFNNSRMPTLSVAGYPLYDWKYDYFEEVRDDGDVLIGKNVMKHEGGIYAISVGLADRATSWLNLGGSLNFLNGNGEFEHMAFGDTVIILDRQEIDCDGINLHLGALAQVSSRIRLGLRYRSEAKMDGKARFSGKKIAAPDSSRGLDWTYPYSVALGVEYRPRNDLTARLTFDAEFTQWSHFEDKADTSISFDDVWQFAGAVEHKFFMGYPFRFGFRYQPSYQDKQVTTTAITFGTGFPLENFQIDFGGEVATRSWRQDDLFPEELFGGVERAGKDRVKESLLRAMVSVNYQF